MKHPTFRMAKTFALTATLALTACGLYSARSAQPAMHDFGPSPASNATDAATALAVDAPPWLRDERMRYRLLYEDPTLVRFYTLDTWLAPPPLLLSQWLRVAVDDAKYRLKLTLTDFEQSFDSPASAKVLVVIHASAESNSGKPSVERAFRYTRDCPSADADGAVSAFAAAVNDARADIQLWANHLP